MTVVLIVAAGMVCAHATLAVASLLRARSLGGRIIAFDTSLLAVVNGIAIHAIWSGSTAFLDIMVVTVLLTFVATVAVARFIEDRR